MKKSHKNAIGNKDLTILSPVQIGGMVSSSAVTQQSGVMNLQEQAESVGYSSTSIQSQRQSPATLHQVVMGDFQLQDWRSL